MPNADVYVTGSNARFLSSNVRTEFAGRGDEIRFYPLSFSEFNSLMGDDKTLNLREYMVYGGMPQVVLRKTEKEKSEVEKHRRFIQENNHPRRIDPRHTQ